MGMAFDSAPFNEDGFMELEFLSIKKRFAITNVVETGTYHGVTTCWLANSFKNVYTTEVNPNFYTIAQNRFIDNKVQDKIKAYQGDSVTVLALIIDDIKQKGGNSLFFLDAHWYANPLIGELNQIAVSGYKPTVICIHDMMNPNDLTMGYDVYPDQGITYTYEWVQPHIEAIYGKDGYEYYFNEKADGARRGALFIINKDANN